MKRILFVEDDEVIYYIVSKYKVWEEYGYTLYDYASNGKEALEKVGSHQYDMIITDIRMPFIDGIELIKKLKERDIDICTILASTYTDFKYAKEGIRLGAIDYIEKPYSEEKVREALKLADKVIDAGKNNGKIVLDGNMQKICDEDTFINKVCECVIDNIYEYNITDVLSDELSLTKDYISRVFKSKTDMNISEFISRVKVEEGKRLIKESNMKIYEISERLGYANADYFTRVFKTYTNVTPAAYKKTN